MTARTVQGEYTRDGGKKGAERLTLEGQAQSQMWSTIRASDGEKGGPNQSFGAGGIPLPAQVANWPTPAARDHKGSSEASVTRVNGKTRLDLLDHRAEQGFSRPAPETPTHGRLSSEQTRALLRLLVEAGLLRHPKRMQRPWQPPTRAAPRNSLRKNWTAAESYRRWRSKRQSYWAARLSSIFVGSLMGWPAGHALCDCSATESSLWRQDMRGALSRLPMAYGPWIWKPPTDPEPVEQFDLFTPPDRATERG